MPPSPRDFTPTVAQASTVRAIFERWDARDPWVSAPALEKQLLDTMAGIVAPRLVFMASPVHAAKFLRGYAAPKWCGGVRHARGPQAAAEGRAKGSRLPHRTRVSAPPYRGAPPTEGLSR